ncbi:MAG TPA: glycoside hydrolase family 31 protein [Lachnospiraceae bacterium]|nr:glycoside hydrolase family 31 protein [Lachnospiraceae bacterium]
MIFSQDGQRLVCRKGYETVWIEPWGKNSVRVRATVYPKINENDWALTENPEKVPGAETAVDGNRAILHNGKLSVEVNEAGILTFYRKGEKILREYFRNYDGTISRESRCLKIVARTWKPIIGGDYKLTVRFEGNNGEKIYGMGQYQQEYLDLKGCVLELAQRNSQISIPFAISNLGYGFLWNNPAVGKASFGKNYTEWQAEDTKQMDYWVTVGETPADIVGNYSDATGHAPEFPQGLLGMWQCKLRYRTQEEVLEVARKYKKLGIPIDVIVIDFFHWVRQGDWAFDPVYWPDPKAMCDELHAMGTKVVVSVWPSVDRKSVHFNEMMERGLLIRTERGSIQTYDFSGDCLEIDVTNPEAREYIWKICKENYADLGIDMFWLDNAEPDYAVYDYDNYRYYLGPALEVSNLYPEKYAQAFYEGQKAAGKDRILSLVRSAWAGSQKYGELVWSGDVPSTFEALRDQVSAGLNMGLSGIPWWTTDIGGFMGGDGSNPEFVQLLLRWFEFAVMTPVLRMHGDRDPHNIPPLSDQDFGGGYLYTGQPNEIWSYGEKAMDIMKMQLSKRLNLAPYIEKLMAEAHESGAPLLRTMFYEFPEDPKCWELDDQYMFGPDFLTAPVLSADKFERAVYLPAGMWENVDTKEVFEGGQTIICPAPLEYIPVFRKTGK